MAALVLISAAELPAQLTIERSPQIDGGWVAAPGVLELHARPLLGRREDGSTLVSPGATANFGVTRRLTVGSDFAFQTLTRRGERTDWQLHARYRLLEQANEDGVDFSFSAGYNGMVGSADVELVVARWFGPLRASGTARAFSNAYDREQGRFASGVGLVLHPLARRVPIAFSADVVTLGNRRFDEDLAWSIGAQAGLFSTAHTVSAFVTNGTSPTLQGTSRGYSGSRVGFEFTFRVPIGSRFGWYRPRTGEGVVLPTERAGGVVVEMVHFRFAQPTIEIAAGATVEWVNNDQVVHTVKADDESFDSRAIRPGRSWRATFTRPGRYPYHCGPHPYMRGVIIVH